jgi:hypothetical protein
MKHSNCLLYRDNQDYSDSFREFATKNCIASLDPTHFISLVKDKEGLVLTLLDGPDPASWIFALTKSITLNMISNKDLRLLPLRIEFKSI